MKEEAVKFGPLQAGIIVLALATAIIHFTLLFPDLIFILNGLGFVVLAAALYAPLPALTRYRVWVRWAFIGYTALTVILWLIMGLRTPIGYVTKLIEVALVTLLLLEGRQK